jgi:hypothetical protein
VYLALQSGQQERAVKMLRGGASLEDKAEFLRESEIMLAIGQHENIIGFVGVSVLQRPWLVVLEFCQYGLPS